MADTTYTDGVTVLSADTMNDVNRLHYTICGDPATLAALQTTLTITGKQTIWMPVGGMVSRTTNGPSAGSVETATNKVMIRTLDFDKDTEEYAQCAIRMPKGWNESTVTAVFTWRHAATTTNFGVVWGIHAVAVSDDDAMDAAFGTAVEVTDTGGTTSDFYASAATGAMTIAGTPAAEDLVIFEVYRKAASGSDTLAIDAGLIGVTVYYTTDSGNDA